MEDDGFEDMARRPLIRRWSQNQNKCKRSIRFSVIFIIVRIRSSSLNSGEMSCRLYFIFGT
jgi:hypothetical protein